MKLRRTLGLMVALAALAGSTVTVAQEPKGAKTKPGTTKKAAAAPSKAGGSIELYQGKSGWRYRIKNGDGKTIAMPTKGYETKDDAVKVLEDIKTILATAKPTEVKE